ncbi:nuclease-like protein [Blastococcus colisei]|uniref:Nuclease-like protein n=2 Tax=Blastococcus colisei TaxID=1564162 RepID=A0A543P1D7_9ACTN|nr:nuclease-like protein [Blastococcus colisei]
MTLGTATTATVRLARGTKPIDWLRLVSAAAAQIHDWAATTEGRRRTGLALQSLDREAWQVARHIRLPDGGHADHLASGPTGGYLLNSRAWHGVVTVDHKGATITPDRRPEAAWTARGQHCSLAPAAAALGRTASAAGSRLPAPRAVVVIWGTFPERLALSGGITYVAGDHLVEWLSGQTRRPHHRFLREPVSGDHVDPVLARSLA